MINIFFPIFSFSDHNVLSHLSTLNGMAEELRNLGSPVTEQQLVMKSVSSLPPSLRNFQSNWLSVPPALQTMQLLTERLLSEEALNKNLYGEEMDPADIAFFAAGNSRQRPHAVAAVTVNEDSAFAARGGYQGYKRGGRGIGYRGRGTGYRGFKHDYSRSAGDGNSAIECYTCHETGHKAYNCPKKKDDDRQQHRYDAQNKRRSYGCVSVSTSCVSSACLIGNQPDAFFCDSAASHHMAHLKDFFSSLEDIPKGSWKVKGVGGVELEAVGKGSIPVLSVVDGEEIEILLKDVLFVPGLGVNLFSVGVATTSRMEILFKENSVKAKRSKFLFICLKLTIYLQPRLCSECQIQPSLWLREQAIRCTSFALLL